MRIGTKIATAFPDGTLARPRNAVATVTALRSPANPLITATSSPSVGDNINGPSVIRVPSWVEQPLGKYYLYFAHHGGKHIRLAYADRLDGPWIVHDPGTLTLGQARAFQGHIASPDVHVDDQRHEIRMYFHGQTGQGQKSGVAVSKDGVRFVASDSILGDFYFRVFQRNGAFYAIAKDGNTGWGSLSRSEDGLTPFEHRGSLVERIRHAAVAFRGDHLLVFHSRKGDAPERIVETTVHLTGDETQWMESEPIDVLQPEFEYEGIAYPNEPSSYGAALRVRQLRDPCIFEESGRTYLFYTISGEMGIAMAELAITMNDEKAAWHSQMPCCDGERT